jgi:hypothetical protein
MAVVAGIFGRGLAVLAGCGCLTLWAAGASAQLNAQRTITDPSTLHIGPGWDTACATGGCPLYNRSELNGFGGGQLDIYQNSSGATALNNPVLLILGVPNTQPQLTSSMVSDATVEWYPSATTGPGVSLGSLTIAPKADGISKYLDSSTGLYGVMTSGQEVYSFLNLTGDHSNSFTNWAAADQTLFPTLAPITGFDIYVFGITTTKKTQFTGNTLLNVKFGSNLPQGSYAVAYGISSTKQKTLAYTTPFTEAGIDVPEPGTLALLGTGLAALIAVRRRTRRAG